MPPAFLLLLGFPGTGKYTVARALAEALAARGSTARVVDNHWVNNPIFGVLRTDGRTPLPEPVWGLVGQVREAVLTAIDDHGPREWSYVFTNYIQAAEAAEAAPYVARLREMAERRGAAFLVVRLLCETEALCRRIEQPERRERLKATSPEWLRGEIAAHELYAPAGPGTMTLDITKLAPDAAARVILEALPA